MLLCLSSSFSNFLFFFFFSFSSFLFFFFFIFPLFLFLFLFLFFFFFFHFLFLFLFFFYYNERQTKSKISRRLYWRMVRLSQISCFWSVVKDWLGLNDNFEIQAYTFFFSRLTSFFFTSQYHQGHCWRRSTLAAT